MNAVLCDAGTGFLVLSGLVLLALAILLGIAVADDLRLARQRKRFPKHPPSVDGMLPAVFERRTPAVHDDGTLTAIEQHRRFDDDTFAMDGLHEALRRMTEGDGRG